MIRINLAVPLLANNARNRATSFVMDKWATRECGAFVLLRRSHLSHNRLESATSQLESRAMERFQFDLLRAGLLGVSSAYGSAAAEAAAYCLYRNQHRNPGNLVLTLKTSLITDLLWTEVGSELDSTWADLKEAAEYGAYALAIIVSVKITKFRRVARCAQSGGIDFWLTDSTDDRGIFQRSARLEVSGIFNGGRSVITARLKQKLDQTKSSDQTTLPAYVAIVEFGSPELRMQKRGVGR
jgi:hypothetical protein